MSATAARRRVIRSIITERPVASQGELVELLAAQGHAVTQATVSRDLQVIGAAKSGNDHYVLTGRTDADEARAALARAIDEFVEAIRPSGSLVVLHTPPGAAQVVAAAIDNAGVPGVIGSVAGDDTVLVVASEDQTGAGVADALEEIGATV
jgi:transcriptional regulator of arginine metabolism